MNFIIIHSNNDWSMLTPSKSVESYISYLFRVINTFCLILGYCLDFIKSYISLYPAVGRITPFYVQSHSSGFQFVSRMKRANDLFLLFIGQLIYLWLTKACERTTAFV